MRDTLLIKSIFVAAMFTTASATSSFAAVLDCTGGRPGDFTLDAERGTLTTASGQSKKVQIAVTPETMQFSTTDWLGDGAPRAGNDQIEGVSFDVTIWRYTGRMQVITDLQAVTGLGMRLPLIRGTVSGSCAPRGSPRF